MTKSKFTLKPGKNPAPASWRCKTVTVLIGSAEMYYDHVTGEQTLAMPVNLVLPNNETRGVGFYAAGTPIGEIRDAAVKAFRKSWDPKKMCAK